ncbi:MAG: glycerophosphodiester phosphodiesterase [Opitutales bacterium]|nr:glycerophosphodiester phosphodiesterase [Opitutales bacterium]
MATSADITAGEGTDSKSIIAHRGASAHLPEHTLEGYALAFGMGADYIEPDLMLTKDGVPVALHDRTLDATTDVADRFPDRAREDGRSYAVDFTLEEIKMLRVRERVDPSSGGLLYPERWENTHDALVLRVPTLAETIELVRGLNRTTGRRVGVYPEIKFSSWHAEQGYDFEAVVLKTLRDYGFTSKNDPVFVQSFEEGSLRRLRELGCELRLVQLIGGGRAFDRYCTAEGLDRIAAYADGIGPSVTRILDSDGTLIDDNFLVREAQARGLVVHPYTMRADAVPKGADSFGNLLEAVLFRAGADGVFTDHTAETVDFLRNRANAGSRDD